ncbi:carbohydrate kinase family protein [Dermabacteraceae bacterium P13138]
MDATFLTAGEALTDIVISPDGSTSEHPGGSPMNTAVALGRLGYPSHLFTDLGDDARGQAISAHLAESGASLIPGSVNPGADTSLARAILNAHGVAEYEFDFSWRPSSDAQVPDGVSAFHFGSLGALVHPGAETVEKLARSLRGTATISFDPNIRPSLLPGAAQVLPDVQRLVALADVVKASDADVQWLMPDDDPREIARLWLQTGPALVVVTHGGDGAWAACAAGEVEVPAPDCAVVDTVGAGDTFTAGLLDALAQRGLLGADNRRELHGIDTDTLRAVVTHASRCAGVAVARPGANPPWRGDVEAAL